MVQKIKCIAIVGPTASGKTGLGIKIAKEFGGEIISVDSRQIYREMDIGTAKEKVEWGIDIVDPPEHFHARDFKLFAEEKIAEIISRGHIPVFVGGTGLYLSGVIDNFDFDGGVVGESKYDVLQIGFLVDREVLYKRIDGRVDQMIKEGLVDEVKNLKEKYGCGIKSMTGIGYRQICEYLDGKIDLEEAIRLIKRDSRHYAKRQMTWFRRDDRIYWIVSDDDAMKLVEEFL